MIYILHDCEDVFVAGDFNGRTGNYPDFIEDIDELPGRQNVDIVKNKHGSALLEFAIDTRYAILNGRITPDRNNFTSVSINGTSVVDYVLTKYEKVDCALECFVISVNDIITEVRAMEPAFTPGHLSDHAMISSTVETERPVSHTETEHSETNEVNVENRAGQQRPTRFKVTGVKEDFMHSSTQATKLIELIDEMLNVRAEQEELDAWYWRFVNIYQEEMRAFYKTLDLTPKS